MAQPIFDVLPAGRENAVSLDFIRAATGLEARAAREEIARERQAGALILSTTAPPGGYFKPANISEVRRFTSSMLHRAANIHKSTRAAQAALEQAIEDEAGG